MLWYHSNSVTNLKGPRGALFYMGPRFGSFCMLCIVRKINNMPLCIKIMLICACVMYYMKIMMNGNYM